jgi:hypothetical protein
MSDRSVYKKRKLYLDELTKTISAFREEKKSRNDMTQENIKLTGLSFMYI